MFYDCSLKRNLYVQPTNISMLAFQPRSDDSLSGSFVAVGIGEAHSFTEHLVDAPWSTGLRSPAGKIHVEAIIDVKCIDFGALDFFADVSGPHIGSIALPSFPNVAEIEIAKRLTQYLNELGAFVVITGLEGSEAALALAGTSSDCYVVGDCSSEHHSYPARTIADPLKGRMICYELYDVLSIWAGRIGLFNGFLPQCDAMHIEVPASVGSLKDVDRAAMQFRKTMPGMIDELVSVIPMSSNGVSRLTCFKKIVLSLTGHASFGLRPICFNISVVSFCRHLTRTHKL